MKTVRGYPRSGAGTAVGQAVYQLDVTPDGRYLVVANEHSGRLTAVGIDSSGLVNVPVASAEAPGVSYVETRYA